MGDAVQNATAVMNALNPRGIAFALKCSVAALVAILIALWLDFPNPGWAGLTVFLTSQPLSAASGALVARSLYRVYGTVAGVAASLTIIPALIDTPEYMVLAVAAWVGVCLYASLLDRSPRGYAFMLAGYTVALVGMPLANDPGSIFDVAVLRAEEVTIGALCAIAIHSVFFPKSVSPLLMAKLASTIDDARGWIVRGLGAEPTGEGERVARNKVAVDLAELRTLASNLRFESSVGEVEIRVVLALEERMVALLPLLSGAEDRLATMASARQGLPSVLVDHLTKVRVRIAESTDRARALALAEEGRALALAVTNSLAARILAIGAMERIAELLSTWNDCLNLAARVRGHEVEDSDRLDEIVRMSSRRTLHVDHGLAAFSGFAATVAVLVAGSVCWLAGWPQGAFAMGIAGAGSSIFAFVDDPRPLMRLLLQWTVIAVPVAAVYVFGILPAVDGYLELAAVLLPLFFLTGLYLATANYWLPALSFALITQTLMALQPTQGSDFVSFSGTAIGAVIGSIVALVVTSLIRVISAETSVWRLLRATWKDLIALAEQKTVRPRSALASEILDRVGMLLPRLARAQGVARTKAALALSELRLGVNLADLRDVADRASPAVRAAVDQLRARVAAHFRAVLRAAEHTPDEGLLDAIDVTIERLLESEPMALRQQGLTAAGGLRLGLFPNAAAYSYREAESAR